MQRYALIGRKLGHSYSPLIHEAFGCESYGLIELEPEQLPAFLETTEYRGFNVTIPYKKAVMPLCAEISDAAKECGSVNTLSRLPDGRWYGDNTDIYGLWYMAHRAGIAFRGKKTVVLGSGGAGVMARALALREGAKEVVTVSRTGENNYENLHLHADAEILMNATPVGMYPKNGEQPLSLSAFPRLEGVLELIYNPHRTALYMEAEKLKIPRADGLTMLVAQAKAAEEKWFAREIGENEVRRVTGLVRQETENIVLIGMPGSGKTTVGRALQALTGREMIDLDEEIERKAGLPIPEIFRTQGEASFRRLETEVAAEMGRLSGKILSAGGGIVKYDRNYPLLHQNGRIYQIVRETSLLSREGRPLSQGADLAAMEKERAPLYAAFRDVSIKNSGTPEAAAQEIWRDFCESAGD